MFLSIPPATKSRLERELAEAVQENSEEDFSHSPSPCSDGDDPGSDTDEDQPHPFASTGNQNISIEMSLWSLDASATSSIDMSIYTEDVS